MYGGLTGAVVLLSLIRTFFFFILLLRASYLLHNKMVAAVLRAPVFFFDNNPVGTVCLNYKLCKCCMNCLYPYIGRVLNRFTKDIGYMDDQLQIFSTLTLMVSIYT